MRSPPTLRRVSRHFWKNGVRVGRASRAPPCACRTNCPESGTENNNEKNATPLAIDPPAQPLERSRTVRHTPSCCTCEFTTNRVLASHKGIPMPDPAVVRFSLLSVPDGVVGRCAQEFDATVGISNCHEATQAIALTGLCFPLAHPAVIRLSLPGVPDGVVGSSAEELDAAIGILNGQNAPQVIALTG